MSRHTEDISLHASHGAALSGAVAGEAIEDKRVEADHVAATELLGIRGAGDGRQLQVGGNGNQGVGGTVCRVGSRGGWDRRCCPWSRRDNPFDSDLDRVAGIDDVMECAIVRDGNI